MAREPKQQGGLQAPRGTGSSQGGAWRGQEKAQRGKRGADDFLGHGGQSVQAYQGPSNPNATSEEDKSDDE